MKILMMSVGGPVVGLRCDPGLEYGVAAEADLTAALLDERRSPIDEVTQPLTAFFRAEPAENRGTLLAAMVIRSPVRGFTPWRSLR